MKIPSISPAFMSFWKLTLSTVVIAGLRLAPDLVAAQTGCYCAPSAYTFSFNFSATCPPSSFTAGENGVSRSICTIFSVNTSVTNLVPVSVTNIEFAERDAEFGILDTELISGPFADGDSFNYTTLTGTDTFDGTDLEAASTSPAGIDFRAVGLNSNGEDVSLLVGLGFTNDCHVFPVVSGGESTGWVTFAPLTDPMTEFCPGTVPAAAGSCSWWNIICWFLAALRFIF